MLTDIQPVYLIIFYLMLYTIYNQIFTDNSNQVESYQNL